MLFGECQSVIIITINEKDLYKLVAKAQEFDIYTQTIGRVTDTNCLRVNGMIDLDRKKLYNAYFNSFEKIMNQ